MINIVMDHGFYMFRTDGEPLGLLAGLFGDIVQVRDYFTFPKIANASRLAIAGIEWMDGLTASKTYSGDLNSLMNLNGWTFSVSQDKYIKKIEVLDKIKLSADSALLPGLIQDCTASNYGKIRGFHCEYSKGTGGFYYDSFMFEV